MDKLANDKKHINLIIQIIFLVLIGITALKVLLVGYDMDEQYAYTLAYRLINGDGFLKEMWEPHQTSALPEALVMYLYTLVFGIKGVVLFSRFVGMIIQAITMFLLYRFLNKRVSSCIALAVTGIIAFTIPKLMFTMDYSNILMWMELVIMLSLMEYYSGKRKLIYLIITGCALMFGVLSYPALIVLVPVVAYIVIRLRENNKGLFKETLAVAIPCVIGLIIFIISLLLRIEASSIKELMGYVLSDGSHSASIGMRLMDHLNSAITVIIFTLIYSIISLLIYLPFRSKIRKNQIIYILVFVSFIGQLFIWLFARKYINFPRVEMFIVSIYLGFRGFVTKRSKEQTRDFLVFTIIPIASFLGVSIFTNHPFLVSAPFLSYVLAGLVITEDLDIKAINLKVAFAYVCLFVMLFGNLLLVRTADGTRCTIFGDVSLIRKGPAFGIIADDTIVTRNREDYDLIIANIPTTSKLMYMGRDSDIYMFGEYEVCSPSTISTPTYDEKIYRYQEINPSKVPEYVVYENAFEPKALELFGNEYEEIASNWYIHIMKKK